MVDEIRVTNVDTTDNREWLISGDYMGPEKALSGHFQAYATNRTVVACCVGAKSLDFVLRVTWKDGRSRGFRDLLLVQVV